VSGLAHEPESTPDDVRFEVIGGPEGACLAVFRGALGERIAGPKPWGGGKTLHAWSVPWASVVAAVGEPVQSGVSTSEGGSDA
jgi:hypothetical protein